MKDPYRYFRVEARELVDGLSEGILGLEDEAADRGEITARLLRLAHTLKGAARVVGQGEIADRAHALEDAVSAHAAIDALLAILDDIGTRLAAIDAAKPPPPGAPYRETEGARARAVPHAEARAAGAAPRDEGAARVAAAAPAPDLAATWAAHVDLDELDRLLETLQDARVALSGLRREVARFPERRALGAAVATLDGALSRIGVHAHELRLVPASSVFAQLARVARDTASALGKRVHFEARGGDCALDGRILAPLRDALLHVVRNAVDHGIEDTAARVAAGKPPAGRIEIDVERCGHRVAFICHDDGRGIDLEAVRRSAERRAVPTSGDDARLVFAPGITTRAEVTPISGRGVGLDVARDIAARLKGEVDVHSEPGRGTTFTITVPVSLSSMPVLALEVDDIRASIPLDAVRTAMRLDPASVVRVGDRESILAGDRALPFLRLAAWLGLDSCEARSAVVVEAAGSAAAVGVGRVLGAAHVIVQPVPPIAGELPVLGASIDAAGTPEPVLDPAEIVAAASRTQQRAVEPAAPRRTILVIDDSLTTRMLEQAILEAAGFHVDVAASAEEALEKAAATPYDLFIVDVEMPGMDGFQFVARTREDPALRAIPSIIVSSRGSDADKRRGVEVGARAWVVKGEFAEDRFLGLVRGLVR
ncbi:Signal transduction histidine kinase CheA [Minicystis rosea]|nr:Signal transduction histidine kinase CheA [Minicystis rosea]